MGFTVSDGVLVHRVVPRIALKRQRYIDHVSYRQMAVAVTPETRLYRVASKQC